eukprot:COSAG01_NODE_3626_length_5856_cov_134.101963_5_plen_191_part_00
MGQLFQACTGMSRAVVDPCSESCTVRPCMHQRNPGSRHLRSCLSPAVRHAYSRQIQPTDAAAAAAPSPRWRWRPTTQMSQQPPLTGGLSDGKGLPGGRRQAGNIDYRTEPCSSVAPDRPRRAGCSRRGRGASGPPMGTSKHCRADATTGSNAPLCPPAAPARQRSADFKWRPLAGWDSPPPRACMLPAEF